MSCNSLDQVFSSPNLYVQMPERNNSYPWDDNYQPTPHQQSAYDFWEYDSRRQAGAPGVYNNNRHNPGDMQASTYTDVNGEDSGYVSSYFMYQESMGANHNDASQPAHSGHVAGGEGRRSSQSPNGGAKNYCGPSQLTANPYSRGQSYCPTLDQIIAPSDVNFMGSLDGVSPCYNQETVYFHQEDSSNWWDETQDVLAVTGVVVILFVLAWFLLL